MEVLNHQQINHKIIRLSYEILENNLDQNQIILAGINNNGYKFAQLLFDSLSNISDKKVILSRIQLNPAYPTDHPITTDMSSQQLQNKTIIIVDDVANTGRTIFYAFKPLMESLPGKIEVAVLVDRTHKMFPIKVDYVGLSLATTLKENISVKIVGVEEMEVHLD